MDVLDQKLMSSLNFSTKKGHMFSIQEGNFIAQSTKFYNVNDTSES